MSADSTHNSEAAMQELRKLLFEKESIRLDELENLLRDQQLHAQEVAKVLAEAVKIRNLQDEELAKSLAPTIEKSIKASIAKDPKSLSDALFPVMGPAIRKSINNAIAQMLQSLNQTLENSFSAQGLKWRLEAFRTGKPFAEVVMLNTLVYRVEQVFLIHKETGLLLQHLSFDPSLDEDADVVSSMLTAVQDFIRDSFSGSTDQGIENLRMGDLEVILETGPDVVLAVVCRGNTPRALNERLQTTVEQIQQLYGQAFQNFDGDTEPFVGIDEHLHPLLVSDFKSGEEGQEQEKKKSPIKAILVVSLIFIAIAAWLGFEEAERQQTQTNWDNYISRLQSEDGIIISTVKQDEQGYTLLGLRDPLSIDPYSLLAEFHIKTDVHFLMQPYHALQESLVLKRVAQLLQPPKSIQLSIQNGILTLTGTASDAWISRAEKAALYIDGVENIDSTQPKNIIKAVANDAEILRRIIASLKPPSTVEMKYAKGILYASGQASNSWIKFAKNNFSKIEEIDSFDTSKLSSKGVK